MKFFVKYSYKILNGGLRLHNNTIEESTIIQIDNPEIETLFKTVEEILMTDSKDRYKFKYYDNFFIHNLNQLNF